MSIDSVPNISIRQLRYFIGVVEEMSFRRAAERLSVSQPPLSRQIKQLETELGIELLSRSSSGIALTPEGKEIYDRAKDIVGRIKDATLEAQLMSTGEAGTITVGYTDVFQYGFFEDAISRIIEEAPSLNLKLVMDYSQALARRLADGELDVALLCPPVPANVTSLSVHSLGESPLMVLLPEAHPKANPNGVNLSELGDDRFVVATLYSSSGFYLQLMSHFNRAGINPELVTDIYPSSMIINLVRNGHGLAMATESAIPPATPGIVKAPLLDTDASIKLAVAWRTNSVSRAARSFIEVLKDAEKQRSSANLSLV